jgi:NitT/TauT family transport system ATP-binding protein
VLTLHIKSVRKEFPVGTDGARVVLEGINFAAQSGEVVVLYGPNGCGKTTLLNLIAGLEQATAGEVRIDTSTGARPTIGVVFQDYPSSLLPWLRAGANLALPLRIRTLKEGHWTAAIQEAFKQSHFEPLDLKKFPAQLSGGQQQKLCIIRALLTSRELLLLDEPFSSLDARSKNLARSLLQDLRMRAEALILIVVHDLDDAILLADRVICLGGTPAHVLADVSVTLRWPRSNTDLVSQDFLALRQEVLTALLQEVQT